MFYIVLIYIIHWADFLLEGILNLTIFLDRIYVHNLLFINILTDNEAIKNKKDIVPIETCSVMNMIRASRKLYICTYVDMYN